MGNHTWGKKDILKVECPIDMLDLDILAFIDHNITVNVIKDGEIIAKAHNQVVLNNDPTAHGEINAIRRACAKLGTFDLSGCEIYTTGYPCPMCMCAIMWSNIDKIY